MAHTVLCLWCLQCTVSETAWENCIKVLSGDPWSLLSRGFWGFCTYQSCQRLIHMNTSFLIYKERDCCKAEGTLGGLARALTQWGRLGSHPSPEVDGPLLQQGRRMHPSFLRARVNQYLPSPSQSCRETGHILIFGLFFSMRTSILLLWHGHGLMWLISTHFISDCFLVFDEVFGGILLSLAAGLQTLSSGRSLLHSAGFIGDTYWLCFQKSSFYDLVLELWIHSLFGACRQFPLLCL